MSGMFRHLSLQKYAFWCTQARKRQTKPMKNADRKVRNPCDFQKQKGRGPKKRRIFHVSFSVLWLNVLAHCCLLLLRTRRAAWLGWRHGTVRLAAPNGADGPAKRAGWRCQAVRLARRNAPVCGQKGVKRLGKGGGGHAPRAAERPLRARGFSISRKRIVNSFHVTAGLWRVFKIKLY